MSERGAPAWREVQLGDLIQLEYGKGLGAEDRTGSGFAVFGSSGQVGRHSVPLVAGPGIVVGRKGTVGAVTWSDESFWPIDTTYYVEWRSTELIDRRWSYWQLSSLPLRRLDSSTGVPGLNRNDAYSVRLSLPPIAEQRRIGEILDTVDEAIGSTESVIAKLEHVKSGLLHDLLTRGVDENGDLRDVVAHPELLVDSQIGPIPSSWDVVSCQDATSAPIGYGIVQAGPHIPGGVCVLMIRDLYGDFRTGLHRTAPSTDAAYSRSRVRAGDVLLSVKATIGRVAVVPNWYEGNISRDVARLRPGPRCLPDYLRLLLSSERGRRILDQTIVGTTRAEVSIGVLRRVLIPLPPLDEQRRLVEKSQAAEQRLRTEQEALLTLRSVKTGLMTDLLSGRVRVKVDDEDAE
jgi:type I restriction enzyme S subunit